VAALLFGDAMGGAGQFILVLGALALGVLTLRSDYRAKATRRAEAAARRDAMGSARAEEIGRTAGRWVGKGVHEYRKRRPGTKAP
jgi:hypothetical protein